MHNGTHPYFFYAFSKTFLHYLICYLVANLVPTIVNPVNTSLKRCGDQAKLKITLFENYLCLKKKVIYVSFVSCLAFEIEKSFVNIMYMKP